MEWTTAFVFPAEAGTHLPTPGWWKAELALGGWLAKYRNKCPALGIEPDTAAHLSIYRARRRLTSLIKANALTTMPDDQPLAGRLAQWLVVIAINWRTTDGRPAALTNHFEKIYCLRHAFFDVQFLWYTVQPIYVAVVLILSKQLISSKIFYHVITESTVILLCAHQTPRRNLDEIILMGVKWR